jgi:PRTRC genetic system ThiF family protein
MDYVVSLRSIPQRFNIVVVGCGGTGGYVAEGLCRLPSVADIPLILIDHDRVEPHNLKRQNFFEGDVGKFKSQALAERLCRKYGRRIKYCIYPYSHDLITDNLVTHFGSRVAQGIIIGCVDDSSEARKEISDTMGFDSWWLDAGNGYSSGQVLLGNARDKEMLKQSFDKESGEVRRLPIPSLQLPSLIIPPAAKESDTRSCAEAVIAEDQSPVINQYMAALVLQFIDRLLTQKLTWMGAYIDLEACNSHPVPADPVTVARMLGVKVDTLMFTGYSEDSRHRLR